MTYYIEVQVGGVNPTHIYKNNNYLVKVIRALLNNYDMSLFNLDKKEVTASIFLSKLSQVLSAFPIHVAMSDASDVDSYASCNLLKDKLAGVKPETIVTICATVDFDGKEG